MNYCIQPITFLYTRVDKLQVISPVEYLSVPRLLLYFIILHGQLRSLLMAPHPLLTRNNPILQLKIENLIKPNLVITVKDQRLFSFFHIFPIRNPVSPLPLLVEKGHPVSHALCHFPRAPTLQYLQHQELHDLFGVFGLNNNDSQNDSTPTCWLKKMKKTKNKNKKKKKKKKRNNNNNMFFFAWQTAGNYSNTWFCAWNSLGSRQLLPLFSPFLR